MNVMGKINVEKIEKRAFINGKYVDATGGKTFEKVLSFDGKTVLSGIACCDENDVDIAVDIADKVYKSGIWSGKTPEERKAIILKMADLMEAGREELALLDTYETGRAYKNYYEDSIPKAIEAVRYFAESIDKLYDSAIPPRGNEFAVVSRVPLGVVGLITPWNDPMVVTCWKLAPALLMGNSVVLKPAEQSSLSAIKLASIALEAGVPDGVFNVVPGYGEVTGQALAMHKKVRGISFTGSSEIGKKMLIYSGESNMKRVTLECGGKGPFIVTDKCKDIHEAARVLADSMFYNQGQICSAPSRVIIAKDKKEEFTQILVKESERYLPGNSFESDNNVGCVVSKEQYDRVKGYIELAKNEGLEVLQPEGDKDHPQEAFCFKPTIITNVSPNSRLANEEIFGPVVVIIPVDSTDEAISIANNSEYGLAGAVWTDDLNEAYKVCKSVEVGLMHINSYGNDDNAAPFGGVKQSGIGKDKSVYAFDDFCDKKTVWMHFK